MTVAIISNRNPRWDAQVPQQSLPPPDIRSLHMLLLVIMPSFVIYGSTHAPQLSMVTSLW